MARYQRPVLNFQAPDVWAAACAAFRLNGSYVKFIEPGTKGDTNRALVDSFLGNPTQFLKPEDYEMGEKVRQHYQAYSFKILKGVALKDFDNNAMLIANRDVITNTFELALIVSLPASYERASKRADVDSRINFATGGYVGTVGDKVTIEVEILRWTFSQNYNTFFITAITSEEQVVFFAFKRNLNVGDKIKLQANVKAFRDNNQTQLNYVKVL